MTEERRIENKYVTAVISQQAAEIISFKRKDNDIEMIWCRDPEYWFNCNPILFPYTGRLPDDKYEYEGKTYTLGQHGFARRALFQFEEVKEDGVTLSLTANEETRAVYPFDFKLCVNYKLDGYKILINYTVINLEDEKKLPFEIGFHPAFNCPMTPSSSYADYRIEFEKEEDLRNPQRPNLTSGNSFSVEKNVYQGAFFYHDGQIKSDWVQLTDGKHTLRVGTKGFAVLGFWRKTPQHPFMCIEPWSPASDLEKAEFFKKGTLYNMLEPKKEFHCGYYFEIVQ